MGLLDELRSGSAEAEANQGSTDYAPAWRWEQPGDGVEGTVVTVSSRVTENHPAPDGYPIVTLRQPNGEDIAVHCMPTVLKNEVTDKRPRVGDEMAFVYDGKKTSSGGRQYNAFRVALEPGGAAPVAASAAARRPAPGPEGASWGSENDPPF